MMGRMPSSRWAGLLSAICLASALLVGCSETEHPPHLPAASEAVSTDQPAKKVLARAVRRMRAADTGTFTTAIGSTRDQGRFHLSASSAEISRVLSGGDSGRTAFTDSIRTPDGVWLRVRTGRMNAERACWVRSGDALGTTTEGIPGAYAGAVGAALTARGARWHQDEILGSVDLVQALLTIDPALAAAPELLSLTEARTKASFTVLDGRLVGWRATSAQLLGALAKADADLSGSLKPVAELDGFVVDVQFDRQGRKISIRAPEPDRVIAAHPSDTLLERGRACMRRR